MKIIRRRLILREKRIKESNIESTAIQIFVTEFKHQLNQVIRAESLTYLSMP